MLSDAIGVAGVVLLVAAVGWQLTKPYGADWRIKRLGITAAGAIGVMLLVVALCSGSGR